MSILQRVIDETLPDAKVLDDIAEIVWQDASGRVEIAGKEICIPEAVTIDIATKAFLVERFDVGYGSCFRVLVAIGGVETQEFGILTARYCFATLYYNEGCHLITVSFHEEMR